MTEEINTFKTEQPVERTRVWQTIVILVMLTALAGLGIRVAFAAPDYISGPVISLQPQALPWYALYSLLRMGAAYVLSVAFTLIYGYAAARSKRNEQVMLPLLDVFQSVPILSFLPVDRRAHV